MPRERGWTLTSMWIVPATSRAQVDSPGAFSLHPRMSATRWVSGSTSLAVQGARASACPLARRRRERRPRHTARVQRTSLVTFRFKAVAET